MPVPLAIPDASVDTSVAIPNFTEPRTDSTYNYDAAIRRRMDPINSIGQGASDYAKTLADRRVAQSNKASQDRMQALRQQSQYSMPTGKGSQFTPGFNNQMSVLDKVFPGLKATSTNGGSHASGSWHYKDRAVDLPASMAVYNWIKANYPNSRELIFSGGNTQIKNGKVVPSSYFGAKTMSEHTNHIHWAY